MFNVTLYIPSFIYGLNVSHMYPRSAASFEIRFSVLGFGRNDFRGNSKYFAEGDSRVAFMTEKFR